MKKLKSKNNRPIIALDMDDVITDCLRSAINEFNADHGTHFKVNNCAIWDLSKFLGVGVDEVMEIFRKPEFFEGLPAKPHAVNVIKKLIRSTMYDVYIVTATSSEDGSELTQKINWFRRYVPDFNTKRIIACEDKYIIRADLIVDDKIENLRKCKPYMKCILMDSPTNQGCKEFKRIKNLKELPDLLDKMFYPEKKEKKKKGEDYDHHD